MKKTILKAFLLAAVFAVLIGSCASYINELGKKLENYIENHESKKQKKERESYRQQYDKQKQLEAERQRQAQERANAPVTQNMFKVKQLSNNTIEITRYTGESVNVVIPSTLYNLPVTEIGKSAFAGIGIKSVVIPDTVTSIGDEAFSSCTSLTSVTIGDGVTSIGDSAFLRCTNLSRVTIGSKVTHIGDSAFLECKALRSITIPDSVIVIGEDAFRSCGLTSVTLGKGLKTIKGGLFSSGAFAENNLTSITLPDGLTEIGDWAFADNKLTDVTLPAGLQHIGGSAFSGNPIQSVTIPAGVGIRGDGVFFYRRDRMSPFTTYYSITRITLPANISDSDLKKYSFEDNFISFYAGQNRAAGTYEQNGPIWARSRAGGVD